MLRIEHRPDLAQHVVLQLVRLAERRHEGEAPAATATATMIADSHSDSRRCSDGFTGPWTPSIPRP